MSLDGVLLMRARARLAQTRERHSEEHERRCSEVYARLPEIRRIDAELRALFTSLVSVALRERRDPDEALRAIDERSLALRMRRAELLTQAGYGAEYLDDLYDCPDCHDSGYTQGRMCRCLKKLYALEQSRELSSLLEMDACDFSRFDLGYYGTEPDPDYGVSPRECMELVYRSCREYAANFGKNSPNLLLQGGTGLGKTFLSACIAKTVAANGFSVVYDTAVSAFGAFEEQKFAREAEQAEPAAQRVRRILSCDLMLLDDLGTEMTTQFTLSALYTIVNSRLTEGKKTIISTNLTPAELRARYTAQICSRIDGEYDTLTFLGRDIRAIKKERRYT